MTRCPNCGAHREPSDDFCPVCGETLTTMHLSEATGPPWYERTDLLLVLTLVFWPAALYGVKRRSDPSSPLTWLVVLGSLIMGVLWGIGLGVLP